MNNNDNETYFFRKIDFNNSHINNILSSFDQNNKYNTFDFSPLEKTKKNFINLKKNITRNIFGNYTYNQRKVISLHKNINPNKNKRCKKINYEKPSKIINLMHRNELRNKLLTSKLYKLVEKTANENYLTEKRKKNTFITTIDEDNYDENENATKIQINSKENETMTEDNNSNITKKIVSIHSKKNKNKNKLLLDLNPTINNYEPNVKFKTNYDIDNSNKYISLSLIESNRNKNKLNYRLKNISLPCITFSSSLNSLEQNPNHKDSLSKTCLAKLKIEMINKTLNETYKRFFEKRDFPLSLTDATFRFFIKNENYFLLYDDLTKKYMQFLTNEIKKNLLILSKLIKAKEDLVKENEVKLKQISVLEDQIKIYESFNNLYLSLKNKNEEKKNQPIQKADTQKKIVVQRQSMNKTLKRLSTFKKGIEFHYKRESTNKTNKKLRNSTSLKFKRNSISKSPKKVRELFKNTQEIKDIFEERDQKVFNAYKKYIGVLYDINQDKLEKEKEKVNRNSEMNDNDKMILKLKNELILLKMKNRELNDYKNVICKVNVIKEKYKYNIFWKEKDEKNKKSKILQKIEKILYNPKVNLEKIFKSKGINNFLKENEFSTYIIYKGETYSKELFYLKIIEFLFLKIEQWKNNCLKDKTSKEEYIKYKTERERELKYLKAQRNLLETTKKKMERNEEIIDKNQKLIFIKNRKFDPFYKKYIHDEIIKKRLESKRLDKLRLENDNDKYNNYLNY